MLELSDLAPLASLPLLRELSLSGNPALGGGGGARRAAVTTEELLGGAAAAAGAPAGSAGAEPSARSRVLTAVPQVRVLDGELNHAVERQEREAKAEARRLSIARSTSALIEKKRRAQDARQAAEAAEAAAPVGPSSDARQIGGFRALLRAQRRHRWQMWPHRSHRPWPRRAPNRVAHSSSARPPDGAVRARAAAGEAPPPPSGELAAASGIG